MRKLLLILLTVPALLVATSCEGEKFNLGGDQSPYGEVGTKFSGDFAGASDINLTVTSLDNGISTLEGSFTMTDPRYMEIIKKYPKYYDVDGDKVTVHNVKFKATTEGVENHSGIFDGTIIKYNSKVGDTYNSGGKVKHVSTDNDFQWGSMKIKVVEVENKSGKVAGVKKVTYWGNHRFGIVAVETEFEDGTSDFATISIF